MNIDICREKCGRGARVTYIDDGRSDDHCMVEIDGIDADRCTSTGWNGSCVQRIEPCRDMFKHPPCGWVLSKNKYGSRLYKSDDVRSERAIWGIRLVPTEYGCPYCLEHTMAEIKHAERVSRNGEYMKSCREAMKRRISDAKADGEKLP